MTPNELNSDNNKPFSPNDVNNNELDKANAPVGCFLCGLPSSNYCPDCGEVVCSNIHMEYHKPPGDETRITSQAPAQPQQTVNCQPFRSSGTSSIVRQ